MSARSQRRKPDNVQNTPNRIRRDVSPRSSNLIFRVAPKGRRRPHPTLSSKAGSCVDFPQARPDRTRQVWGVKLIDFPYERGALHKPTSLLSFGPRLMAPVSCTSRPAGHGDNIKLHEGHQPPVESRNIHQCTYTGRVLFTL